MNEMLHDSLAFDRYHNDIRRAEANYARQTMAPASPTSPRARFAGMLVSLAAKLQPEAAAGAPQPANPLAV